MFDCALLFEQKDTTALEHMVVVRLDLSGANIEEDRSIFFESNHQTLTSFQQKLFALFKAQTLL